MCAYSISKVPKAELNIPHVLSCWWCPSLIARLCDIDSPEAGHFYRQRRYRGPGVSCIAGAQAMLAVEGFTLGIAWQTPEDPRRQSKTCVWMPANKHKKWPTIQQIVSFWIFGLDLIARQRCIYFLSVRNLKGWKSGRCPFGRTFCVAWVAYSYLSTAHRKSWKAFSIQWISFGRVVIGYDPS